MGEMLGLRKRTRTSVFDVRRLRGVDMRSARGRRFRSLLDELSADVGGFEALSTSDRCLVRHVALLTVQIEELSGEEAVKPDALIRLHSEARRALERLQDRRGKFKAVTRKTLEEHIARRRAVMS